MPIVNGINYNEKFITDEELAVVEAMRLGANVDIDFHNLEELDQVDECMNLFADFPKEGCSWINDKKDSIGYNYISFFKQMGKINVACYLNIQKKSLRRKAMSDKRKYLIKESVADVK